MVVFGWVILVALSVWVSIAAFIWAVQSGQFADQERARFLPLAEDLPPPPAGDPAKLTREAYALLAIGGIGLVVLVVVIVLTLSHLKG